MNSSCNPKTDDRYPMTDRDLKAFSVVGRRSSVVGFLTAAVVLGLLLTTGVGSSTSVPIKFATLAPEGSTWMQALRAMDEELRTQSGGRVHLTFYPGGVAGDEIDVLRKIRIGQLHGGAFSGVGLGAVLPAVRVLELPLLFRDAGEVDYVTAAMEEKFARAFEEQGFVLLAFAEAGFVHIFSKRAIRHREDLNRVKVWTWQGDPLALAMFRAYEEAPVPLALPEVFPSLQTGLIDAFYAPPLAAIALQWFSQVSYMSSEGFTNAIGGMLIARSRWEAIPAALQGMVKTVVKKYARQVVVRTRQENQEALKVLNRQGIQMVDLHPEERNRLLQVSREVWEGQAGKLYPRALLEEVQSLLKAYRERKP